MLETLKSPKTRRPLIALCVVSLFFSANQLSNTVIAYIMSSYSDLSSTTVQQIMTLPGLVGLGISFVIGPLALKISKKTLLIICTASMLVYFIIFLVVGPNGPFFALLIAAGFAGITNGSTMALVGSEVAELFDESKRAAITAMTIAFQNIGLAILNMFGGTIAAGNGGADWPRAYFLGFLIIPALIVFTILMPKDKPVSAPEKGAVKKDEKKNIPPIIFLFVFVQGIFCISRCAFQYNYSSYIITEHTLGSSVQAGFTFSIFTVISVVVSLTYSIWDKLFKNWISTIGYAIFAVGMFLMLLINTSLAGIYLGALLIGFGFSILNPYCMARVMGEVSPRMVPVSMSIFVGTVMISMYVAPYVLNFFGNLFGGSLDSIVMVGAVGGVICSISSVFMYVIRDKKKAALKAQN